MGMANAVMMASVTVLHCIMVANLIALQWFVPWVAPMQTRRMQWTVLTAWLNVRDEACAIEKWANANASLDSKARLVSERYAGVVIHVG